MAITKLSDPIWDTRLQAIWIIYAGVYSLAAADLPSYRWIESIIITVGGLLVIILLCQTLIAKDHIASRKTLLVAFGSLIFILQKSADPYHDYTGTLYASIFGIFVLIPLWLLDANSAREQIILLSILAITAGAMFSLVQLGATLVVKWIIVISSLPAGSLLIAPHVAGIAAGMSAFLFSNSFLLRDWARTSDAYGSRLLTTLVVVFLYGFGAFITTYSNWATIIHGVKSNRAGLCLGVIYFFTLSASITCYLSVYRIKCKRKFMLRSIALVFMAVILATITTSEFEIASAYFPFLQPPFEQRFFFIELIPSFTLILCCWVCANIFRKLAGYMDGGELTINIQ